MNKDIINKKGWENIWKKVEKNRLEDEKIIQQELVTYRWKEIESRIIKRFGSFRNIKTIEVGSGRGEISLIFNLRGAKTTLLDYVQGALDNAALLFKHFGCHAQFICADAFNLPPWMLESFDVSMSFGTAEHYDYPQRQKIFNIHAALLRPGGVSFICVPNKLSLPYHIWRIMLEINHEWVVGKEIPFTIWELKKLAFRAGYNTCEVVSCSSFFRDNKLLLKEIKRIISQHFPLVVRAYKRIKGRKETKSRPFSIEKERPSIFDIYFSGCLMLVASK